MKGHFIKKLIDVAIAVAVAVALPLTFRFSRISRGMFVYRAQTEIPFSLSIKASGVEGKGVLVKDIYSLFFF